MGMAAAQAKLLSLTARRSDINYQLSSLMRGKLDLMTQASNAADALSAAQRNNNIFVMTTSDNQQTQLSFNSLSKEGLTIVDAKCRTIVPSSYRGNVKGLANVLPASHPAVKSYDGDFVPKTKLTKNYVSIPENTIPMFAETDPENREQKTVKKYESNEIDINTLSGIEECYNTALQSGNLYEFFAKNNTVGLVLSNNNNFANYDETKAVGKGYNYKYADYNMYTNSYCQRETDLDNLFKANFGSECGEKIDTKSKVGELNNMLMGGDEKSIKAYTTYENRSFQTVVDWETSKNVINKHIKSRNPDNTEITYVSNAEQFITALLKNATVTNEGIQSNANIMLLNDIDLDDMLQDEDGKGGLKAFIQNEISTLKAENNTQINDYNKALDNFINLTKVDTSSGKNTTDQRVHSAIRTNLTTNLSKTFYNLAKAYGLDSAVNNVSDDAALINNGSLNDNCVINKLASMTIGDNTTENQKKLIMMAQDAQKILQEEQKKPTEKEQIELSDGSTMSANDLNSWDKIAERLQAAAAAAAVGGTQSKSGIDASVIANVYAKYFSGGTNDKFNEKFTNFIQIDKFTGAIGGGGFAINNLKMAATSGAASMFGTLDNATLHGIYMENANVIGYHNSEKSNLKYGAILAQEVKNNSCTLLTVKGDGITIKNQNDVKNLNISNATDYFNQKDLGYNLTSGKVGRFAGLVGTDSRTLKNLTDVFNQLGVKPNDISSNGGKFYSTGWTYDMSDNNVNNHSGLPGYSQLYKTVSMGIRTDGKEGGILCSSNSNINPNKYQTPTTDVRRVETNQVANGISASTALLTAARAISGEISNKTPNEIENKSLFNGKIRLFQTKTETKAGKDKEISGWDKDIDWDNWEYVDENFVDNDGSVTLVKKHGEETEEYLQIKDLLEFYKEQNVRVEYDENRETGYFTYSASGYSIDVEYKEDLNKYLSDNYLYKVENNDSSIVVYERDKVVDIDSSQLVFVDDIEAVLDKNIKNGVWFVQGASVSDASKYERKSLDEIGISETTDEKADAVAQAEYDRKIREIEIQEEKYDAQITELESTLKGIEQEIENQEKIVKQNIQSSFSTFSS